MNAIAKTETRGEIMENVLIRGDISKLTIDERGSYYNAVCSSLGLNPLTKPFEYLSLNGKLRLYALKDCTDQLRSIHGISVTELVESEREGVFIVKAKVSNKEGRTDVSTGAVNILGLKGEALANALMKTETKAKRRATLSICGLGMLDETEVDDIPASAKAPVPSPAAVAKPAALEIQSPKSDEGPHRIVGGTAKTWSDAFITAVQSAGDISVVYKWVDANKDQLEKLGVANPERATHVRSEMEKHIAFLRKTDPISSGPQKSADDFPGDVPMDPHTDLMVPSPKPRGRPKGSGKAAPDMSKDYDGWVAFYLHKISEIISPEALEELFSVVDNHWDGLFPPDKESLMSARRDAESRLEQ